MLSHQVSTLCVPCSLTPGELGWGNISLMPGLGAAGRGPWQPQPPEQPGTLPSLLLAAPAGTEPLCWPPRPLQAGRAHSRVSRLHHLQRAGGTYFLMAPGFLRLNARTEGQECSNICVTRSLRGQGWKLNRLNQAGKFIELGSPGTDFRHSWIRESVCFLRLL